MSYIKKCPKCQNQNILYKLGKYECMACGHKWLPGEEREEKKKLKDLFTGRTLNGPIEAARTRPLIDNPDVSCRIIKNAYIHGMDAELMISYGKHTAYLIFVQHPDHRTALYPTLDSEGDEWKIIYDAVNKHQRGGDEFGSFNLFKTWEEACEWVKWVRSLGFEIYPVDAPTEEMDRPVQPDELLDSNQYRDPLLGVCTFSSFYVVNDLYGGWSATCETGRSDHSYVDPKDIIRLAKRSGMNIHLAGVAWRWIDHVGGGEEVSPYKAGELIERLKKVKMEYRAERR